MVVKYLKVKVQGLKYYVTEECNILVGAGSGAKPQRNFENFLAILSI